eukprot:gene11645-24386_t
MGSASSFTFKAVDKVKLDREKRWTRAIGKCQLHSVDRFLKVTLQQIPQEDSIKAIVENPIAFSTFADFLAIQVICGENTSDFISITDDNSTSLCFETVNNIFKKSLQNACSFSIVAVDAQSPDNRLFALSCRMLPGYLESAFFMNWRLRETSGTFSKDIPPECTLPELEPLSVSPDIKSNIVSGHAEVIHPSIELDNMAILSVENSYKTSNTLNMPIGILLPEHDYTAMLSDSTSCYSSIHDNPRVLREKILRNCDQIELSNLLRSDKCGWITAFITASETLPIGITLSSISRERPGYPVIYLNKHFEDSCGYNREEILGERFGFMQRPGSTIFSHSGYDVMNASKALESGENIVSRIDLRRHGKIYSTLVTTKRIFDRFQNSKFVIGLHMEVQSNVEAVKYMVLLQKLVNLIPSSTC